MGSNWACTLGMNEPFLVGLQSLEASILLLLERDSMKGFWLVLSLGSWQLALFLTGIYGQVGMR